MKDHGQDRYGGATATRNANRATILCRICRVSSEIQHGGEWAMPLFTGGDYFLLLTITFS